MQSWTSKLWIIRIPNIFFEISVTTWVLKKIVKQKRIAIWNHLSYSLIKLSAHLLQSYNIQHKWLFIRLCILAYIVFSCCSPNTISNIFYSFRCKLYKKNGCRGNAKIINSTDMLVNGNDQHNHDAEECNMEKI